MKTKKLLLLMVVFFTTTIAFAQSNYQDVVYLKNGSIIRGVIIEQVPNESLKIETADGNLFVYKIDDVEKMTKERVTTQQQTTTTPQQQVTRTQSTTTTPQRQVTQQQNTVSVQQQSITTSQPVQIEKKTQWGIKGGLNNALEYTDKGTTDSRVGIHLGAFMESTLSNKVDIQPELVYSMQGCNDNSVTEKIDYINLPVMFKIYVNQSRSFSIDVGPQIGYMLSYKVKFKSSGNTVDIYDYSGINKIDVAICLGVSYKINENFHVGLRYNYGVTKFLSEAENRNAVAQLGVGYMF